MNYTKMSPTFRIIILSFIFSTTIGYSFADWVPPTGSPPSNNVPPPVNVGSASQVRDGNLFLNNWLIANKAQTASTIATDGGNILTTKDYVDGRVNTKVGGNGIAGYLPVWTSATTLGNSAIYQGSGVVGIGTSNPTWLFSVGSQLNPSTGVLNPFNISESGDIIATGGSDGIWAQYDKDMHRIFQWNANDDTLGIAGTEDPAFTVRLHGSIAYDGGGLVSDIRYKKNIEPIKNALDKVMGLNGVTFDWNNENYPNEQFKKGKDIGLIAQEVEKVLPEVVLTDSQGYKAIEYGNITALLVEGMKQQQKEINELKAKYQALEDKINSNK